MKVLMINTVCGRTSTGRICSDIAEILSDQGHDCKIAYGRAPVPENAEKFAVKIGGKIGIYIHALCTRFFDNTGFCSKYATKKFLKWVDEYNPDVIHLHNLHGYYINIKLLFDYLKKGGKPVVWTLHDCWAFTGHCPHYTFEGCDKWKTGCFKCPLKKEYPASAFFDRSRKNYFQKKELFCGLTNLTIVTPSEWLAGEVKKSFLKDYSVKVINNGIDLNLFRPTPNNLRDNYSLGNDKIILGVANIWSKRKGIDDFIKLSEMLDDSYKIVIVGKLQGNVLPKNILHISHTDSQTELAEIYSASDVFLNPTYEEVFGMVNLEALACGTPVITYRSGGSPEMLDNKCGKIVASGDMNELKEAILKFSADENDCINKAAEFNKADKFNEYIALYKEIIK